MEAQRGFPSTWGGICSAALGVCCVSVPYLRDLLQAALGRRIPPGSIAFIIKTNVFYHPFHPRMKAQIEITRLPTLPWWATLLGAHPPQRNGVGGTGKANGSLEQSLPLPKKWDAHGDA